MLVGFWFWVGALLKPGLVSMDTKRQLTPPPPKKKKKERKKEEHTE